VICPRGHFSEYRQFSEDRQYDQSTIPGTSQEEADMATRKLEDEQLWLAYSSKVRLYTLEMAEFWLQKKEWGMAAGRNGRRTMRRPRLWGTRCRHHQPETPAERIE
jgi:hypothetical protein